MRGVTAGAVLSMLVGCSGDDPFTVPEYVGGILLQGDCPEDVEGTNIQGMEDLYTGVDPLIDLSGLEGQPGKVVHDQAAMDAMMIDLNFGFTYNLDWATQQVAAVWYHQPHGCELTVEADKVVLRTSNAGGLILDAQFFDSALNCGNSACTSDLPAVVLRVMDTVGPASVCRRVRPGCEP